MNVKNKISLLLLLGYCLLLVVLLGQRFLFVVPDLKSLQKQSDLNEVEHVVMALQYKLAGAEELFKPQDLSRELIAEVVADSKIKFKIYPMRDVGNSRELAAIAPKLDEPQNQRVYRSGGHGYRWLKGEGGEPVALLKVSLSAPVYSGELIDHSTWWVLLTVAFTLLMIHLVVGYVVIKPLYQIKRFLIKVRDTSNYSLRMDLGRHDEVGELASECDRLVGYVHVQDQYLNEINQDLTKKTLEDGLTEVASRRHFDVKLDLLWRAFYQKRQPLFLILVDVDNFKAYNDNYGHLKGDEALKAISDVILGNVRVSTDMVARYGGEEFVILLSETDVVGVKVVCDKLLNAIRTLNITHEYSDTSTRVTVSMGVSGWIPDDDDTSALVESAEKALNQAKQAGRDCVQYHIRDDSIGR